MSIVVNVKSVEKHADLVNEICRERPGRRKLANEMSRDTCLVHESTILSSAGAQVICTIPIVPFDPGKANGAIRAHDGTHFVLPERVVCTHVKILTMSPDIRNSLTNLPGRLSKRRDILLQKQALSLLGVCLGDAVLLRSAAHLHRFLRGGLLRNPD